MNYPYSRYWCHFQQLIDRLNYIYLLGKAINNNQLGIKKMANIKVQDLTSIIQDLSKNELDLHGGLCGVIRTIYIGGRPFTIGGKCLPVIPSF
jgi:hypothetical protein